MKKYSQALVYYITIPFLYFFSILTWPLLSIFSDFFSGSILYYQMQA